MFRSFALIAVLFAGCGRPELLDVPAKTIECPLCDEDAKLTSIQHCDAYYKCPNNHKTQTWGEGRRVWNASAVDSEGPY